MRSHSTLDTGRAITIPRRLLPSREPLCRRWQMQTDRQLQELRARAHSPRNRLRRQPGKASSRRARQLPLRHFCASNPSRPVRILRSTAHLSATRRPPSRSLPAAIGSPCGRKALQSGERCSPSPEEPFASTPTWNRNPKPRTNAGVENFAPARSWPNPAPYGTAKSPSSGRTARCRPWPPSAATECRSRRPSDRCRGARSENSAAELRSWPVASSAAWR